MHSDLPQHPHVDALRGIAVLLVMLAHTAQPLAGLPTAVDAVAKFGQTGVQLFFVVSAYTLCLSAARRRDEPRPLASFYLRRLFRIAPLYTLAVALYFGLHVARQVGADTYTVEPYTLANVAANLLFVHGFVPAANNSIVPGGWSIGTEMAFYAIFPLLFAAAAWLGRAGLPALALGVAALLALNLLVQTTLLAGTAWAVAGNNFTYFSLLNQLPVFALGLLVFHVAEVQRRPAAPAGVLVAAGAGCMAVTVALWALHVPLLWALIPVTAALAFCALLLRLRAARGLPAWLCRVGSVSYSMYVFHFVFAWIAVPALLGGLQGSLPAPLLLVLSLLLVFGGTFAVALLSERWIEAPGIALGRRLILRLQARAAAPLAASDAR